MGAEEERPAWADAVRDRLRGVLSARQTAPARPRRA
jgi:hypothetical protein